MRCRRWQRATLELMRWHQEFESRDLTLKCEKIVQACLDGKCDDPSQQGLPARKARTTIHSSPTRTMRTNFLPAATILRATIFVSNSTISSASCLFGTERSKISILCAQLSTIVVSSVSA